MNGLVDNYFVSCIPIVVSTCTTSEGPLSSTHTEAGNGSNAGAGDGELMAEAGGGNTGVESEHSGGSESEGEFIDWEGIGRATSVIETEQSKTAGVEQLPTTEQGAKNKANDGKGKKRKLGGGSKTAGVRKRDREQSYSPCHSPPPKRPTRSNLHLPGWSRQMGGHPFK